ncbi:acetyltransferase [Lysinibacillus sphaericus]|uniref:GNAT family N-acetyltransferase n=1 Tax=Lysinibacillus sphaericus TaxID=1421 RepID=UPI0018CF0422|nr:GNAT family N-acetyltransferase [Lysinibacillus sphaericus]MBG9455776.1 acetyltransferase [Lysinibacillus sphaericus]MBG9477795.1 acetyltransferase [Lysinibacillus sphaericus]MBG9593254.1 acetyltransferase [Lysinibacillus sphaericus]
MTTFNQLQLVVFEENDIPGLIALSDSVGWDYDEFEIRTVMKSGEIFGHKNDKGEIVSSAAIITYDSNVASIGMVIVHENYRGLGLGKLATQKCIESVSAQTAIMLVATEEGEPLYKKMGFATVDYVHKYLNNNYFNDKNLASNEYTIEDFNEQNFADIVSLDAAAFGVKRSNFLQNRIKQSKQSIVMKDSHGKIIGFGLSILGPLNLILGPIIAPDSLTACFIINTLAKDHNGKLRIDVPSGHAEFIKRLEQSGFTEANKPPVMILHAEKMPTRNDTLFAIAAQIFG